MGANSSGPGVYAVSAPPVAPVARVTIKKNEPRLIWISYSSLDGSRSSGMVTSS
jgi:hypothetical protein